MNHSPLGYPGYQTSVSTSYTSQRTASVERVAENGNRVSLNASISTSYSYTETRYTPSVSQQPVTYQAPANQPESDAAQQAKQAEAIDAPSERNSGTKTILAFIEQRLATDVADGATPEELQSRLQAGFDGFMQGYSEALEQIKAMGLYEGDVKAAVDATYNQVLSGFAEMADKYGLENPAPEVGTTPAESSVATTEPAAAPVIAKPADRFSDLVTNVQQNREATKLETLLAPVQDFYTQLDKEESESRLYRFNLRTTDGDMVSIQSYADQGYRYQSNGNEQRLDIAGMEDFRFSVRGELDADEITAIADLLAQVNDIAEVFFAGDIDQAFAKALEIGFDSDEIARFSLNLSHTEYSRIENTYGPVAQAGSERLDLSQTKERPEPMLDNTVAKLVEFVRQLESFRERSEQFQLRGSRLEEFARFASHPKFGAHPQYHKFPPFFAHMGETLSKA